MIAGKLYPETHTDWILQVKDELAVPVKMTEALMSEYSEEAFRAGYDLAQCLMLHKYNPAEVHKMLGYLTFKSWEKLQEQEK